MLPKYGPLAASPRQRFFAYLPYLEAAGIEVSVSPLFSDQYLQSYFQTGRRPAFEVLSGYLNRLIELTRSHRFDCLMVHFELFPFLPYFLERLSLPGRSRVIFDFDDAIHHQYDRHGNAMIRSVMEDKISRLVSRASAVTAGNVYLAEFARQAGCRRRRRNPAPVGIGRHCSGTPPLPGA